MISVLKVLRLKREERGFLLVVVLFIIVILATMGMALLGTRSLQHQSTSQALLAAQAKQLGQAGIEDARCKFEKDPDFPSGMQVGQSTFDYAEDVFDSGRYVGSYRVTIDLTNTPSPYNVIAISSTGYVGPRAAPAARHIFVATMDINPSSIHYYRFLRWEDGGSQ